MQVTIEKTQMISSKLKKELRKENANVKQRTAIFDNEFMPHHDAMYNFAFRLTYDEDNAKDLVQDTYLKAYRFAESFQEGTNAKAWLYRILKNSFIDPNKLCWINLNKKKTTDKRVSFVNSNNFSQLKYWM